MTFRKVSVALAAAMSLILFSQAFAHRDDDDDDEEHEHRRHNSPSKNQPHFYYHYLPAERVDEERWRKNRYAERMEKPPTAAQTPGRRAPSTTPSLPKNDSGTFPRESSAERAIGKQRQRAILESELGAEGQLLQNAQRDLARTQAERSDPQQLQAHRNDIERHQSNIAALKRELSSVNR